MRKMYKIFFKKIKPHLTAIIVLILITLLYFNYFYNEKLPPRDITGYYLPAAETLKISLKEYKDPWPLWTPYGFSGTPFLMKTNIGLDSLLGPLLLLIPNTIIALKLTYILLFLIAGLSMYALMLYLKVDKKFAFISALIYILNGHNTKLHTYFWLLTIGGYALLPLFFLFGMKSVREQEWVRNSVITGIILAILLRLNPDVKILLWGGLIFALYILFSLLTKLSLKRAIKISLVSGLILIVFFGLSAQRILSHNSYIKISSRGATSWEIASGRKLPYKDIFNRLIEPVYKGMPKIQREGTGDHIGIIAFLLAAFAVYKKRKSKKVIFFAIVAVLSVLIATNTFKLYYLLWHLPFFKSMRYMDRTLFLFVFAGSILAGIGANEFFKKIKDKKNVLYAILVILIITNLWLFSYRPYSNDLNQWVNVNDAIKNNYILQYLSKERQKEIFRVQTYETTGIDWGTDFYNVPLRLEHIYRYDTAWYPPYMNVYLSVAYNDPAKFWGILNLKYLTARNEINVSGFKFVKKFENCTVCFPDEDRYEKAWGPYLYENEQFLPRAYIVENSVLVVGEEESVTQTIYGLMLNKNFNPENTVIIRGKKSINDYDIDDLNKFSSIFLTKGSIDQDSVFKLQHYTSLGGILLPDITKNENSVSEIDINNLFNSFKGNLNPIDDKSIIMHNFDKREIKLSKQKGFLVYSEKFSVFEGWGLTINNKEKEEILNADAMVTAVYLKGDETSLTFNYKPKPYIAGLIISVITLIGVVSYLVYGSIRKNKKEDKKPQVL